MYLLGATLTKLLATLAAVMTVTAGLPGFECRCPDGRVKLFCQGNASSPSGCCCAAGDSSFPEAKSCCCEAKKANGQEPRAAEKRSCCTHSHAESQKGPGSDGPQLEVKATCCVKTVVAATPVDSVADAGTGVAVHQLGDTFILWEPSPVPPSVASGTATARPPPGFLTAPPDLIVILCHFTC